ncbi:MAG: hydrogenase maturation protease [Acidimicrobiales bacterium]
MNDAEDPREAPRERCRNPEPGTGDAVVVAGVGNSYRRDDGVGPVVAALVAARCEARDIGPVVDPLDLLGRWDRAEMVVVVDAIRSPDPPGTIQLVELHSRATECGVTSTHGISLGRVLRLAETIGRAPSRVVVIGITGAEFGVGTGLSAPVGAAVPIAVRNIVEMIETVQACA